MSRSGARARLGGAGLAALLVVALDQLTKGLIRGRIDPGDSVELILGIELVRARNSGVAFGLLGDVGAGPLIAIAALFVAGLVWFLLTEPHEGMAVPVGLLVGGAVGNLTDRLRDGAVTDFIDLPAWPAFNVADVAITLGVGILLITLLRAEAGSSDDG